MIEIKSAKITSTFTVDVLFTEMFETEEKEMVKIETAKKFNYAPHKDLIDSFDELRWLMLTIVELHEFDELHEPEAIEKIFPKYRVTGFVCGGAGDTAGVTLIGAKKLTNGSIFNIITPFTKFSEDVNGFAYAFELQVAIENCKEEILNYMAGKKAAPDQLKFEFDEPPVTETIDAEHQVIEYKEVKQLEYKNEYQDENSDEESNVEYSDSNIDESVTV